MSKDMIERTFVMIKPDGVERLVSGRIIKRFEDVGLKIVGMKMVWADEDFSKKHYEDHVEKAFYQGLEDHMISGPVIAMVLEGIHAVELVRKIVGATEPTKAAPGTIRGDFAQHSIKWSDSTGVTVKNLIHASSSIEDAKKEVALWFEDKEMHSYPSVHDKHVL